MQRAIPGRASTFTTGRPTWRPTPFPNFEAEFGVRVRYATYESNEEMLAKVLTGNSGWDVVFPTHNRLQPMREYGLLAPLAARLAAQPGQPRPAFSRAGLGSATCTGACPTCGTAPASPTAATCGRRLCALGGSVGRSRLKGRLTMLDDPEDMLGRLPEEAGLSFSATDPDELRRAEREAIAQKPLLRAYLNAEVRDQLVSGDVLAAQLWSTTAQQAIDAAPNLAFAYPAEGFPFYCDCAVILRESRADATGAPISGLPAAPPGVRRSRPVHQDSHRESRRPPSAAGGNPQQRHALSRPPKSSNGENGRGPCRLQPNACATASGRKSSLRSRSPKLCGAGSLIQPHGHRDVIYNFRFEKKYAVTCMDFSHGWRYRTQLQCCHPGQSYGLWP